MQRLLRDLCTGVFSTGCQMQVVGIFVNVLMDGVAPAVTTFAISFNWHGGIFGAVISGAGARSQWAVGSGCRVNEKLGGNFGKK
jgi:hypothetical protein